MNIKCGLLGLFYPYYVIQIIDQPHLQFQNNVYIDTVDAQKYIFHHSCSVEVWGYSLANKWLDYTVALICPQTLCNLG